MIFCDIEIVNYLHLEVMQVSCIICVNIIFNYHSSVLVTEPDGFGVSTLYILKLKVMLLGEWQLNLNLGNKHPAVSSK